MSSEIKSVSIDRVLLIVIFLLYYSTTLYSVILFHYPILHGELIYEIFFPHFYRSGVEVIEIVASRTKS